MALIEVGNGEYTFDKVLSKTDIECRFSFPTAQLHHLFNPHQPFPATKYFWVADRDGNPFLLRLRVRRDRVGHHLKPEISGDWRTFTATKGLNPGDMVVFYRHPVNNQNSGIRFTITGRKRVVVFGQILGYGYES